MNYNVTKLHNELKDAGIPLEGCSSDGRIDFLDATQEQKDQAEIIKTNHNPVWYKEERQKEYPSIQDQLDMQYHDLIDGTTIWKDKITEIKNKYPKQ